MHKISVNVISVIILAGIAGCAGTGKTRFSEPLIRVSGGINKGGITENTDLSLIPGTEVDAFTGATNTGAHAGVHIFVPKGAGGFETGLEYMYNNQTFTYNDAGLNSVGFRNIYCSQLQVPALWNFGLIKNNRGQGLMHLKIGPVAQINMPLVKSFGINLPDYQIRPLSGGVSLGMSITPLSFKNGNRLGFYVEGYRGTRVFEDYYNRKEFETTGSSYMKAGISFEFGNRNE